MTHDTPTAPIVHSGVPAAAQALGISKEQVRLALAAGHLTGRRLGRRILIEHSELLRFVSTLPRTDA
jgi:excisionase family DNA binding protein